MLATISHIAGPSAAAIAGLFGALLGQMKLVALFVKGMGPFGSLLGMMELVMLYAKGVMEPTLLFVVARQVHQPFSEFHLAGFI